MLIKLLNKDNICWFQVLYNHRWLQKRQLNVKYLTGQPL